MVAVHKFTRKAERITRDKAERLRQTVLGFELPDGAAEDILVTIARHESGGVLPAWKFNMISPEQCLAVWEAIWTMPRPIETRKVFDLVLTHLEPNTGAVTLTREEIAERIGTEPANISTVMSELERRNVIFRRRLKVEGMRGRGPVRYYLNPHAGWNGSLEVRAEQARQSPLPLDVIEGGKSSELALAGRNPAAGTPFQVGRTAALTLANFGRYTEKSWRRASSPFSERHQALSKQLQTA